MPTLCRISEIIARTIVQNEEYVMIADRFILPVAAEAFSVQDSAQTVVTAAGNSAPLLWAGSVLLVIVLIGLPVLATWVGRKGGMPLKGLGLPAGSVRSMLALMTVGIFVVVATFGQSALGSEYERVLTTLATLAGPVLGFYFGSRGRDGGSGSGTTGGGGAGGDPSEAEVERTPPS